MTNIDQPDDEHTQTADSIHLPSPTIWPIALAAGIAVLAFGVMTSIVFTLSGLALIAISIGGWIGDLRHE